MTRALDGGAHDSRPKVEREPAGIGKHADDTAIRATIDRLVAGAHELRTRHQRGPLDEADEHRLRELGESIDQYWDLLRQRRARREFGLDPDDVALRDSETLKHYRQ